MSKLIDLIGKKFGKLTVAARDEVVSGNGLHAKWVCTCDCGNKTIARGADLRSGKHKSCGCLRDECTSVRFYKHGKSKSKIDHVRDSMISRCVNPKSKDYPNYGGRGIAVCEAWKKDAACFFKWALSSGYKEGLTIDRIDNSKGYCPENCRWTTQKVQANNRRKRRINL